MSVLTWKSSVQELQVRGSLELGHGEAGSPLLDV